MEKLYGERHPESVRLEKQLATGALLVAAAFTLPIVFGFFLRMIQFDLPRWAGYAIDLVSLLIGLVGLVMAVLSKPSPMARIALILAGAGWFVFQLVSFIRF